MTRQYFNRFYWIIHILVKIDSLIPRSLNKMFLCLFRGFGGRLGILIRYILIKNLAKSCGNNVIIKENVYLFHVENLVIGDNVSIHPMCYIECQGGLNIGNNVSIAHASTIMTTSHVYNNTSIPIKYNKGIQQYTTISDDVWIGCGVRILIGVHIGSRVILGAGAVVNRDVTRNSIYAGVPAKKIKSI